MLTLAYPWLLLALPAPLLIVRLVPSHHETRSSVRVPRLRRLAGITGQEPASGAAVLQRSSWGTVVLCLLWASALVAAARPQLVGEPISKTIPSRDLLLAVDLSGSMDTKDFTNADGEQVDRLTAVKEVLDDFLKRREGDRVGLIFFGSAAFVQAPFTEDLDLCRILLDEAQVRMAGPQTVVGDAVGLSLTVFDRSEQDDRVLILLTDGNDTGSKVPPDRAAAIAKSKGVTIHTIAVGDPKAAGEAKIDEEVLQKMAKETNGGFYRADDREQLKEIYDRLDKLETRELETESFRPKSDLFQWPLAAFLLLGLAYHGGSGARARYRRAEVSKTLIGLALVSLSLGAAEAAPVVAVHSGFHFLRPAWLIALVPVVLVIVAIAKRQDATRAWRGIIDENLLRHLMVNPPSQGKFRPVHLLAVVWGIAVLALAGPTWRREPAPFTDDEAAVIFAIEVTPTMLAQDVQPSRLERGVHKIRDLLDLRGGAKSALIAYSGSAHLVMPITGDTEIIGSFAEELDPEIMPREGDAAAEAISLASEQLRSAGLPGSIVLITDGIDSTQEQALNEVGNAAIHILAVAGDQSKPLPLSSPPAPALDRESFERTADAIGGTLTIVTPDDQDVRRLNRNITTSFVAAQQADGGERWMDMGYWLTPWIAVIAAIWFRPGWVVKWE